MLNRLISVGVVIFAASCAIGAEPQLLPQKLLDEGWISLFDGETMFGWQPTAAKRSGKWSTVRFAPDGDEAGLLDDDD